MNSGILLLRKPTGISSARVLGPLKRSFPGARIGHTGTLDPFAQGLLVVLVGSATKLSSWFLKLDKTYLAEIALGAETDTLDTEGSIIEEAPVPPFEKLRTSAREFCGTIMQTPPAYSALKVDGRRAYERARRGELVEIPPRPVEVYDLDISPGDRSDRAVLFTHCSSGTYIRALARDIARSAGSRGYCVALQRDSVGPFSLDGAVTPEQVAEADDPEALLISTVEAVKRLGSMPVVSADSDSVRHLRHGKAITSVIGNLSIPGEGPAEIMVIDRSSGSAVAILARSEGAWTYRVVFPGAA
ncbi:MAG: tRNA pseudouridine(55) synthase TruB [Alkalispirochaeta sp.]